MKYEIKSHRRYYLTRRSLFACHFGCRYIIFNWIIITQGRILYFKFSMFCFVLVRSSTSKLLLPAGPCQWQYTNNHQGRHQGLFVISAPRNMGYMLQLPSRVFTPLEVRSSKCLWRLQLQLQKIFTICVSTGINLYSIPVTFIFRLD